MGAKSNIEWTEASWTPVRARVKQDAVAIAKEKGYRSLVQIVQGMEGHVGPHCERVSAECDNCYSETSNARCLPHNGTGLPFDRRARDLVDIFVDEKILMQPLHWKKPRKIFVCSQTDLFGEFVTDEMIDRVFAVMALCQQHTFQVLTKRASRMKSYFLAPIPLSSRAEPVMAQSQHTGKVVWDSRGSLRHNYYGCGTIGDVSNRRAWPGWPLPNVWLGVSAGTQKAWKERVLDLAVTPAVQHFVSAEPLLEDLGDVTADLMKFARPLWLLLGGESGRDSRVCRIEWIENLLSQASQSRSGVSLAIPFVKQLGSTPNWALSKAEPIAPARGKCDNPEEWPESLRVREWPC